MGLSYLKRRTGASIFILVLLLLLVMVESNAAVFKCRDSSGQISFQGVACTTEGVELHLPAETKRPALSSRQKTVPNVAQEPGQNAAGGEHFLWLAEAGKGRVYLLGSIHFGTPAMYPLPAVMIEAFDSADSLVVEANILAVDSIQMTQLVMSKGLYQDGTTLQQSLSNVTWNRVKWVAASYGIAELQINQQRPWLVSMTLTAMALRRMGYREDLGIDLYFLKAAQGRKKIIELESIEQQLSLFEKLNAKEQALMLEETLRELDQADAFFKRMLAAWQTGDGGEVESMMNENLGRMAGAERLNQIVLLDRNVTMTDAIDRLARQGGIHFVVVGAGHLPGEKGIVGLLKKRGYMLRQM